MDIYGDIRDELTHYPPAWMDEFKRSGRGANL